MMNPDFKAERRRRSRLTCIRTRRGYIRADISQAEVATYGAATGAERNAGWCSCTSF